MSSQIICQLEIIVLIFKLKNKTNKKLQDKIEFKLLNLKQTEFYYKIIFFFSNIILLFYNKYLRQMMLAGILLFAFFWILYLLFQMMAILIVVVLIGALMTMVYFNQNKLLYMPVIPDMPLSPSQNPGLYRHPSSHALETLDLQLTTSDGLKIRGWHVKRQEPSQLIIYFHQNAGSTILINQDIGFRIPLIRQLSQRTNSQVILVAYRGYSDSQGFPTQQGLQIDAQTILNYAIEYCKKRNPQLDIFLYGRSLGGAVSIYIGSHPDYKNKIKGLILQNTFTSISDMIDAIMPVFKYIKFLQRNHWTSLQRIPKIQKPIMFIRSLRDQIVPTSQMARLYQNVDQNIYVQEYQIPLGTHNCSWQLQKQIYFQKLNDFLEHPKVKQLVL